MSFFLLIRDFLLSPSYPISFFFKKGFIFFTFSLMAGWNSYQGMVYRWHICPHDYSHFLVGNSPASGALHSARAPETHHQVTLETAKSLDGKLKNILHSF